MALSSRSNEQALAADGAGSVLSVKRPFLSRDNLLILFAGFCSVVLFHCAFFD